MKQTYKVVTDQPVLEKQPGSEFEAAPSEQLDFLVQIGALKVTEKKDEPPKRR